MTKKELEIVESILLDFEESDDRIEQLEHLLHEVRQMYEEQCEKKLGHAPVVLPLRCSR